MICRISQLRFFLKSQKVEKFWIKFVISLTWRICSRWSRSPRTEALWAGDMSLTDTSISIYISSTFIFDFNLFIKKNSNQRAKVMWHIKQRKLFITIQTIPSYIYFVSHNFPKCPQVKMSDIYKLYYQRCLYFHHYPYGRDNQFSSFFSYFGPKVNPCPRVDNDENIDTFNCTVCKYRTF